MGIETKQNSGPDAIDKIILDGDPLDQHTHVGSTSAYFLKRLKSYPLKIRRGPEIGCERTWTTTLEQYNGSMLGLPRSAALMAPPFERDLRHHSPSEYPLIQHSSERAHTGGGHDF